MVQADYAYIPLRSLIKDGQAKAGVFLQKCITTELLNDTQCIITDPNVVTCLSNINKQCLQKVPSITVPDVGLPSGHFLTTLSYVGKWYFAVHPYSMQRTNATVCIGVQCIVFSAIAHATLNRALRHPSWLVSTIGGLIWLLNSLLTFYTVTPGMKFTHH